MGYKHLTIASQIWLSRLVIKLGILGLIIVPLLTSYIAGNLLNMKKDQTSQAVIATPLPIEQNIEVLGEATPAEPLPTPSPTTKSTPKPTKSPTPTSKTQKVNFGVVVNDYANKTGALSSLEKALDYKIATVSIFKQFGHSSNKELNSEDLRYIKESGKKLLIAWEPWNPDEGMNQSTDYLKSITEGKQDGYIHSFAASIKSFGNPVELRFGHEMNGNWYPWGNRADDYIKAYQHIVDVFRKDNVQNVKWMWSINAENVPFSNITSARKFYPGDSYVDLIGIDGFNFGKPWRSFSQLVTPSYNFAATFKKPISISETASAEIGGDKAEWIKEMFSSTSKMPQIREIVWFNLLKEADWRIDSTHESELSFKNSLKSQP